MSHKTSSPYSTNGDKDSASLASSEMTGSITNTKADPIATTSKKKHDSMGKDEIAAKLHHRALDVSAKENDKRQSSSSQTKHNNSITAAARVERGLALHGLLQISKANLCVGIVGLTMLQSHGLNHPFLTSSSSKKDKDENYETSKKAFVDLIANVAQKYVSECPPFVHLSAKDSAPPTQVQVGPPGDRLSVKGGMRGYRMARASHGVDTTSEAMTYFYEVLVMPSNGQASAFSTNATTSSSSSSQREFHLPPKNSLRVGKELEKELDTNDSIQNVEKSSDTKLGLGHLRLGWSMRTGDLQAPVGFDKWSYGLRDIGGSKIHSSKRDDNWGGESFGPGDVIGFAIHLNKSDHNLSSGLASLGPLHTDNEDRPKKKTKRSAASRNVEFSNHIRFFKNGKAMGDGFVSSKGRRSGCEAFDNIENGVYVPAISLYMGACARVNFGPHFIFPIAPSQLPTGMKLKPMSERCPKPIEATEAVKRCLADKSISRKTDPRVVEAFELAIETEAKVNCEAYAEFLKRHVLEIREARIKKNSSITDLPDDE